MSSFERSQRRLFCQGVQLTRSMSACDPGKWPVLQNARSVLQGTLQARVGLTVVAGAAFGSAIHTLERFDDPTPFATVPHLYVVGAGVNLYDGAVGGGAYPQIDTGYSGDPLSLVEATPPQSPQPWIYVADRSRMRKVNANGKVYVWGLAPPTDEPSAVVQALGVNVIDNFFLNGNQWMNAGTQAGGLGPVLRVNTSISQILYDSGASGYASVVPVDPTNIHESMLLSVGAGLETVAVTETTIAVASTTIAAIIYDAGTTGLCTIQPAGSLGVGQLEGPSLSDYNTRAGLIIAVPIGIEAGGIGTGVPPPPSTVPTPRIRQIDFPVNAVVSLGGATETVRILSVAVGKDGVHAPCRGWDHGPDGLPRLPGGHVRGC